jgi:two-component system sensor kinase FixL
MSALALIGSGRSVDLDLRIRPDAVHAKVERVQIQQVLLNLMRNAAEAMEHSPVRRVTVTTARQGDRVAISIADTGPGLPDAVRARLFQPFVTTKSAGLGIGLSICRAIVQGHGGELTVENDPSGGTVFRFTVEASDEFSATDLDQ